MILGTAPSGLTARGRGVVPRWERRYAGTKKLNRPGKIRPAVRTLHPPDFTPPEIRAPLKSAPPPEHQNRRHVAHETPLLHPLPATISAATRRRVLARLTVTPSGCLLWQGSLDRDGYGRVWLAGRPRCVHQLTHLMFTGPVPPGLEIDHLCGVRNCAAPAHLEAVTHQVNCRRAWDRRRQTRHPGQMDTIAGPSRTHQLPTAA